MCIAINIILNPVPGLMTFMSVTVSGNTAVVCVDTEDAATVKLILTDVTDQCHITNCENCLTGIDPYCSTSSYLLCLLYY